MIKTISFNKKRVVYTLANVYEKKLYKLCTSIVNVNNHFSMKFLFKAYFSVKSLLAIKV